MVYFVSIQYQSVTDRRTCHNNIALMHDKNYGDFCPKSQIFTTPVYLTLLYREIPWNFITAVTLKILIVMPLPDGGKSLMYYIILS